jgi:hypothetical protein
VPAAWAKSIAPPTRGLIARSVGRIKLSSVTSPALPGAYLATTSVSIILSRTFLVIR